MKMKNKKLIIIFAFIFSLFLSYHVSAETDCDVVISLEIDNPMMKVNGEEKEIDEGRGTKPIIMNDRTLVPIRAIIEALGGNVLWEEKTKTVTLSLGEKSIRLVIDSDKGIINGETYLLDVAPVVIEERTMIPIRFVSEGFNLGVAWDSDTRTIYIIRNSFEAYEYQRLKDVLPMYSEEPYAEINGNKPFFEDYEIIPASFEFYSDLDEKGRCDVCIASVSKELMSDAPRKSIESVIPTGWKNTYYEEIDGNYIYNRCHLIGHQLTGENANRRNLITGTRYLNMLGMLPFENMIHDYVEESGNHVMYRVTPVFTDDNLVADGVLLEAYSVEDSGKGISFCVYCYNVQPGIIIDYANGNNKRPGEKSPEKDIYASPSGEKYHFNPECGGKNSIKITVEEFFERKLAPCSKCAS